ncbi:hypothetical protein [Cellulomonas sp. Leaf395]|uniref:hypothetical protein n=1 Tax=Cellulomonas sp. Leaf395 TaxID=1736362 RepID=UPI0006FB759C|nr:hypothetical protein [Cellulomonas sp. Leaf395]KQT01253.1 hypothetical protein ASG23_06670 [Cellulomonas sp. Leaf395]
MYGQALELELKRVNTRLARNRMKWVGIWVLTASSGLPLLGDGGQDSWYMWVFLVLVILAIAATFGLQRAYFRDLRRKQVLIAEALRYRGGA